jgi:hypothetical protein
MARNIYVLIIFLFVISIYQQMKANQKKEKSYEITKYELVKTENDLLPKLQSTTIYDSVNIIVHPPYNIVTNSTNDTITAHNWFHVTIKDSTNLVDTTEIIISYDSLSILNSKKVFIVNENDSLLMNISSDSVDYYIIKLFIFEPFAKIIAYNPVPIVKRENDINLNLFPNPSDNKISIDFELEYDATISIVVLDVQGKVIKTLVDNENKNKGYHKVEYNLNSIPQGNYSIGVFDKKKMISKRFVKIN